MIRRLPINAVIKFKVSFMMGGRDIGLNDNRWHQVPGDALGVPIRFNTESVLIDVLASERTYPLIRRYRMEERISELKTALGFKWILGWETITNPQNELPLYIGAKFKTCNITKREVINAWAVVKKSRTSIRSTSNSPRIKMISPFLSARLRPRPVKVFSNGSLNWIKTMPDGSRPVRTKPKGNNNELPLLLSKSTDANTAR